MPIDLNALARKLKRVRTELLLLSLQDVAEQTGIATTRLEQLETAKLEPTGDEILILADAYGEPVEYFLTNETSASIEKSTELYRKFGESFAAPDRQGVQRFLQLCRFEHEIESLLGSRPRVRQFVPAPRTPHMKTSGARNAMKVRHDFELGDALLTDPYQLARELGCHVFRRHLGNSSISGLMIRHETYGSCLLINYSEDTYRQRFSVAHELCHALLDTDYSVNVSFADPVGDSKREWRANSFASHLLFPNAARDAVPVDASKAVSPAAVLQAAGQYQVNPMVVLVALKERGRIDDTTFEALAPTLKLQSAEKHDSQLTGERGRIRDKRLAALEAGLDPTYVQTCLEAFRRGEISVGKLAEVFLVGSTDLVALVAKLDPDFVWER